MTDKALILIDIQNDYFAGGALELSSPDEAALKASQLLNQAREDGTLIVHIQHITLDEQEPYMRPDTHGVKTHESVAPVNNEWVIQKNFPNSFWQTELEDVLTQSGVSKLMIAGMMTHMCVSTTARAAMERGYDTTVITDACATMALPFGDELIPAQTVHKTALAEIANLVDLKTTEEVLG